MIPPINSGGGSIAPDFSSSATQTGDTISGYNTVPAWPFGSPASNNMLMYIGLGVAAVLLWQKKRR